MMMIFNSTVEGNILEQSGNSAQLGFQSFDAGTKGTVQKLGSCENLQST